MTLLETIHGRYVHTRRVRILRDHFAELLPPGARALDVGTGDGWVARLVMDRRPDVDVQGIDVLVREGTHIPVKPFDGSTIPYDDGAFDAVTFVDVLHHTADPMVLLREAARVARRCVLIKDHLLDGLLAGRTLRFMDRVSNTRHGVVLPYNYWTVERWHAAFTTLGLKVVAWKDRLKLYPGPFDWIFGRSLHFIARLDVPAAPAA